MAHANDMMGSDGKYLKVADVPKPILVRVWKVSPETLQDEKRWIMHFKDKEQPMNKGLVLNKTNIKRAISIFKSEDTDAWVGKECVLYTDPDVEFEGRIVGGLRIRPTKQQAAQDDSTPF